MKFSIDSVVLWPKKNGFSYREVKFEPDKINIITGASRTGKSAIIPIIDYCLGSDKCTIPVDTIRNSCAWFGVKFKLENEEMLLCRREPGSQASTGDMYIQRGQTVDIPDTVKANTNVAEIKNQLNELFGMSFLDLDPSSNSFSTRPSYRDFMAFLFQPQNIVANADVMFYKADTTEHRQKLINVFPYALGAVTPKVLASRLELEKLKKQRDRIQREIDTIKNVSENWKQEVSAWLVQAKEMGFTDVIPDDAVPFEEQVRQLALVVEKTEQDSKLLSSNIKDLSQELVLLRKEEQEISSKLFILQKRHTEMVQLKQSIGQYEESLSIQVQRLEISTWLKSLADTRACCPFCNNNHVDVTAELDELCAAIADIEKSAGDMKSVPAAFERELQVVGDEIYELTERLKAVRNRIVEESGKKTDNADKKYTLAGVSRFLGRLEANIQTYQRLGKDEELETQLVNLEERIEELSAVVNESIIRRKLEAAVKYINQKASEIIKGLDAEHPDDPIEFVIKDLTLRIKSAGGRDDYLWEIGSASNWLAYHIASILALQQHFQVRGAVKVPNFIIFDQPSQVYFPQLSKNSEEEIVIDDEDKQAVKKIFTTMSKYIQDIEGKVQIIVTEHADDDIWGDVENTHLVARWRGNNEKLVPVEWLQ